MSLEATYLVMELIIDMSSFFLEHQEKQCALAIAKA